MRFLKCVLVLIDLSYAEEKSIMEGSTNSPNEVEAVPSYSPDAMTDGNFKSMLHSDNTDLHNGSKEFVGILTESFSVIMAFVQNRIIENNDGYAKRLTRSNIWMGNDVTPYSENLSKCTADFFDSGFYEFTTICEG